MLSQALQTRGLPNARKAPPSLLRGSKAQPDKSQGQRQQMEWPQSRCRSMSAGDADSQSPERDQRLKHQLSNNHRHTDCKAHPQPVLLSCIHHQDDRDATLTAARRLGVGAAEIPVQVVTALMSFPLR